MIELADELRSLFVETAQMFQGGEHRISVAQYGELYLYFPSSRVTNDLVVDCLQDLWMTVRDRFHHVQTLLLNLDNGSENHSHRTQLWFVRIAPIPVP